MNMGICDGLEAGSAIASALLTLTGSDRDAPIIKYGERRRKIASDVIGMTRMMGFIATLSGWKKWIRDAIVSLAGKSKWVRKNAAWQVSGLKFLQNTVV
jgi:2-polyprenyl-6-methoxyphenol hydroxylase-like FAD-dependent oxidoreductase